MTSSRVNKRLSHGPLLFWAITALVVLQLVAAPRASAQSGDSIHLDSVPAAGTSYTYSNVRYHITVADTAAGRAALAAHVLGSSLSGRRSHTATSGAFTVPSVPSPGFYPSDLVYFGGQVLTNLLSHNIYVNEGSCGGTVASCWGNPAGFLKNLGASTFIQLTNQYTGTAGTYGVGTSATATQVLYTNTISESQIFAIVHAAAAKLGNGYGHIYHVFLPAGMDTCFDQTSICYSPDNPSSFYFCAYHGSLTFSDSVGHVILSVEPYQNVPGCQAAPPNPNGQLADSTNSVLSHELFESITDPDPGSGWVSDSSLETAGSEIGDLCEPLGNSSAQFLDSYLTLNGHKYEVQLEYSNTYHACAGAP